MFKKIILSSLFLIISAHAMDDNKAQELPKWIKKAASVTVILENGYLTNTKVTIPINDDTTVSAVKIDATKQLAALVQKQDKAFNGFKKIGLVACYGSVTTLYSYSHQSPLLRAHANIKEEMKQYNTATFALITQ